MAMAVSLFTPVLNVIKAVHDMRKEHNVLWSQLRVGIRSLGDEMEMIQGDITAYEEQTLQELAYEIEDFMHSLATPGALGFVLTMLGKIPGDDLLVTVGYFKERIQKLQKRQESQRGEAKAGGTTSVAYSVSSIINHDTVLVGNAKLEFEELLSTVDAARLGVISIVGCRGLGKTALARAVYKEASVIHCGIDSKAWVVASEYKDNLQGLLNKILEQLPAESEVSIRSSLVRRPVTTTQTVYAALQKRRYLVVIDDMLDKDLWDKVKSAFPNTAGSNIIATTSIHPIATYVGRHQYTMPYLDIDSSRKLLHQTMGNLPRRHIVDEDIILRKCDGIPLTLISVATHLSWNRKDRNCNTDVAKSLCTHITGNGKAFGDLKRTLVECYDSLPGYQDRMCLLSVSMFPQGHQINMKSLVRKWIAEGLVDNQKQHDAMTIAYKSFKEFLERSIFDPVLIGNNSDIKRCQVNGTMLEFIVYNSTCATNFATLIHPHGRLPTAKGRNAIRRLFVWDGGMEEEKYAEVIRWLKLCPNARFDLRKCSLVRVLDLESCKWIGNEVLENICKLVLVKYLGLRGTNVSEIPKEIKLLVNLETLDIRDTKVNILPIEVAMIPGLVHLFGLFKLVSHWPESIIEKAARVVKEKLIKKEKPPSKSETPRMVEEREHKMVKPLSKLETLAGVIIDKDEKCFEQIMLHSKKLKKVKILCSNTASTDLIPPGKFCGGEVLESLSVSSSESIRLLSAECLKSSSVPCTIKCLKLTGKLVGLPDTPDNFMKLHKVVELQLSSTGRRWKELSVLQEMYCLVYLKLTEDHHASEDDSFIVQKDGFQDLERLCIQAPRLPKVQFEEGAMPYLTSLQLLQTAKATPAVTTPQPVAPLLREEAAEIEPDVGVEGLSHLVYLSEVILHHSAPDETIKDWRNAAKKHVNRPHVKKQPFIATKEAKNKAG